MGQSFYNCAVCNDIISDYWDCLNFCESCESPVCDECLSGYEKNEEGELLECPACDQFRHMADKYGE